MSQSLPLQLKAMVKGGSHNKLPEHRPTNLLAYDVLYYKNTILHVRMEHLHIFKTASYLYYILKH